MMEHSKEPTTFAIYLGNDMRSSMIFSTLARRVTVVALLASAFTASFVGCRKLDNLGKPSGSFQADYVLPIAYADLNVYELINSSNITAGPNNLAYLTKESTENTIAANTFTTPGSFPQSIPYSDTLSLGSDVWEKVTSAAYRLDSVRILIETQNALGQNAVLRVTRIYTTSAKGAGTRDLIPAAGSFPNSYAAAGSSVGIENVTGVLFTEQNSNAKDLFQDNYPDLLIVEGEYRVPGAAGGLDPAAFLDTRLRLDVPLSIDINSATGRDTVDFNIGSDTFPEVDAYYTNGETAVKILDGSSLTLKVDNQFPINLTSRFYLLNDKDQIIDSLHAGNGLSIPPGTPTTGGKVKLSDRGTAQLVIPVNSGLASNLNETKKVYVISRAQTYQTQLRYVQLYTDYITSMRLTGDLKLEVSRL